MHHADLGRTEFVRNIKISDEQPNVKFAATGPIDRDRRIVKLVQVSRDSNALRVGRQIGRAYLLDSSPVWTRWNAVRVKIYTGRCNHLFSDGFSRVNRRAINNDAINPALWFFFQNHLRDRHPGPLIQGCCVFGKLQGVLSHSGTFFSGFSNDLGVLTPAFHFGELAFSNFQLLINHPSSPNSSQRNDGSQTNHQAFAFVNPIYKLIMASAFFILSCIFMYYGLFCLLFYDCTINGRLGRIRAGYRAGIGLVLIGVSVLCAVQWIRLFFSMDR